MEPAAGASVHRPRAAEVPGLRRGIGRSGRVFFGGFSESKIADFFENISLSICTKSLQDRIFSYY